MSAEVEISRTDRTADDLKAAAKKSNCKDHRRRLRAIARVLAGEESRSEVARRAGVDLQTLRDWVRRCNEEGADGLKNRPRSVLRIQLSIRTALQSGWSGPRRTFFFGRACSLNRSCRPRPCVVPTSGQLALL